MDIMNDNQGKIGDVILKWEDMTREIEIEINRKRKRKHVFISLEYFSHALKYLNCRGKKYIGSIFWVDKSRIATLDPESTVSGISLILVIFEHDVLYAIKSVLEKFICLYAENGKQYSYVMI